MSIAAEELRNQLSEEKKNAENPEAENRGLSLLSTFPWFYGILRKCRESIGTKHPNTLNGLLYAFVKELCVSIKDCYSRPNRAGKLRDLVCQMLVYFNMIDRDLKEECMDNNSTYLHLMTELLAMYLDLEIKASKRSVHSLKKIGQFMSTALYTHLGQSEDLMVEAILKAKLITKSSGELCAPVLCKILKDGRCFIGDENAFVRFLLAFKLLQKITRRTDRHAITRMAMRKLNPAPELVINVRRMNIFPQQKIMDEPITAFLMNAKFDFIKAKLDFLRTGSITKAGPCEIFQDKHFTYDNQSDSITNLLKQCNKDEEKDVDKRGGSTDFDLDPSFYKLSLHASDGCVSHEFGRSEDDNCEIEFLGTQNKTDKPVTLITLNSDDETEENSVAEKAVGNATPSDSNKDAEDESRQMDKEDLIVRDSLDMKSESCKQNTSKNFVPEKSAGDPDSGEKEKNSSTKHAGGLLPSILQSPEHGVIESTNNFIDSVRDDSFRSPIRKNFNGHSNTDEGKTEVSCTLDFVDSTAVLFNEDYVKTREPEITSTAAKSESFGSTGEDLSNLTNDLYRALNFGSHGKSWDIACADSPHGFFPSDTRSDVNNSVVISRLSTHENGSHEAENCSSASLSKMQQNSERMNTIHKYSQNNVAQSQGTELSHVDSVLAKQEMRSVDCQPGMIQRTNESNNPTGVAIVPKKILHHNVGGEELDRSLCVQPLVNGNGKVSQIEPAEIGSKNLPAVSENLDKIIGTPAKKVNYENVLKSYKIVKSKSLKPAELPRSPLEQRPNVEHQSNDSSGRSAIQAPKFIKVEKSGLIGNSLIVENGVKFESKSLDFRTSKSDGNVSGNGKAEGATEISVESKSRTSQRVPIIFKKIEETKSHTAERKRKVSQRGGNSGKPSKSNQASIRTQKSNGTNVIKKDINMKSTLKHINTSSIPQFNAEIAKDCPKKYKEKEPGPATVKCNYPPAATQESRTVEIKLIKPDKFLGLKGSEAFPSQGSEPSVTPVMRPCAVQYPPNYERASYVPISHADGSQEISFNQFPTIYSNEQSLYCKKPEYPYVIQNAAVQPCQGFFVDAPATKFEPQKPNMFESDYQDIYPVLNSDVAKNLETEREQEVTKEGVNVSEDCDHGRTSSLEFGIEFSSVWSSGKVTSSTPRDLIISEISVGELRDVDEELRDFVEPWEGPKDYCPDDDEFFLSALPDPQKLFSVEDFSHLDETFPSTNFNFEALRSEDFGNMNAFDDKCLCDIRVGRDLDVLESTFNENFFVLQEKFPDVAHTDESSPDLYEPCTKSPRMSLPESGIDDQPKPHFKKGRRSSCSETKKASCSKPNRKGSIQGEVGVLVEGNSGQVDKKKLRSDSVAYHTRSITQKGIPIEYTLVPPKRIRRKNKPA